jgi:hypothetical protein
MKAAALTSGESHLLAEVEGITPHGEKDPRIVSRARLKPGGLLDPRPRPLTKPATDALLSFGHEVGQKTHQMPPSATRPPLFYQRFASN